MSERERVEAALARAMQSGGVDEAHHKAWVIDQMVRILTGCPTVERDGRVVVLAESPEYLAWVAEHNAGEDGPDSYTWDEGIAP